jgi:protein O-mannosyl-transferase
MEPRGWEGVWLRPMRYPAVACALLVGATGIAYWPVTQAGFTNYDDPEYVTTNSHVQAGLRWKGVVWAFQTFHASNWHPLSWLSHMLDVELFGRGAAAPHCVNLLLHLGSTVLLFLWLRRMSGAHWCSFLVAALFGLHPLHVESVAWVAERKDVLSTFFGMLTLLVYGRYVEQSRAQRPRCAAWYALALVCFALGLLSKPMLVTLPFVLLLLDYWPLRRFEWVKSGSGLAALRAVFWEKIPFFLLSAGSCVLTALAQSRAMSPLARLSLGARAANALVSYARYLGKTLWPTGLAVPYQHPGRWDETEVALAALLVVGLCVGAWWARQRWGFLFTGWFWFWGTMIPVIGLVQVGSQAMADRYTYVPLVGLFIMVAWGAAEIRASWRVPAAPVGVGAALLLVGCGLLTWRQAGYWQNSERLFRHAAAVTTGNYTALANIGVSLFDDGKLDEAMRYFRQALNIKPDYADALSDLGAALEKQGNNESVAYYQEALRIDPRHSAAWYNLGNAMAKRGRIREAAECFQTTLEIKPDHLEARNNLANALVSLGRMDEAVPQYRQALELNPQDVKVMKNLGAALVKQQKVEEAVFYYRQVLERETNDLDAHYALGLALALQNKWPEAIQHYGATLHYGANNPEVQYNLGYALRMQGRLDDAAVHLREALRLKPDFAWAHFNLACVLADQGRKDEAISHLQEALRLDPAYDAAKQQLRRLGGLTKP